ncbi:MAG: thermonuclease family protein [Patescibacteria group bacterium]|nr:thermonuclease family protein [Patescibacteria group bacterium]
MSLLKFKENIYIIVFFVLVLSVYLLFTFPLEISEIYNDKIRIMKVYDGDTVAVIIDGKHESVRLIGINSPEKRGPYTEEECYGNESTEYLKNLLLGQMVELKKDELSDNRDKYERLLRYIYLEDENINLKIIRDGQARLQYGFPHSLQNDFKATRDSARKNKLGLWGKCE